jgi:formyltetrahydrofolate synthetase
VGSLFPFKRRGRKYVKKIKRCNMEAIICNMCKTQSSISVNDKEVKALHYKIPIPSLNESLSFDLCLKCSEALSQQLLKMFKIPPDVISINEEETFELE